MWKLMWMIGFLLVCATPLWAAPFTDNGNATVTDQATGLVWQQTDDDAARNWQGALDYCNALSLGGSTNWRLPNIKELRSIVDVLRYNPSIDPVFSGTNASQYWSSSSSAKNAAGAWIVLFSGGTNTDNWSKWNSDYVRCVR